MDTIYDLIIIGAGPAGMTASIYASCFHLNHIVIGQSIGGQILMATDIMNYPGFIEISGKELTEKMLAQLKARGATAIEDTVTQITKKNLDFVVLTKSGKSYSSHTVILATGTERKKLNVPGELEYASRGVYYCVVCERQDYEGKNVAVVGGSNSAAQSAIHLAQAAASVFILYRGTELRCDPEWAMQIKEHQNITVMYNTVIKEIYGDGEKIAGVKIVTDAKDQDLPLHKLFIEIGGVPGTSLIAPLGVGMDPGGFIRVNEKLETNIPGLFAAGDLISYGLSIEQISSAVGLGARAAASSFSYLKKAKAPSAWGQALIKR